ncbi:MAG: TetR/AcrR family transcriptional regulator [Myxococcota bacterium]
MARPTTIDTARIVDVARDVFLEHGAGVSTAVIARELGISEGSIYKRFPTKDALFRAALGLPDCAFVDAWPDRVGEGDPRANLVEMGDALVEYFRELLPRMVMVCSRPHSDPHEALRAQEHPPPVRIIEALVAYLEGEREAGRVGAVDAPVTARMLLGALQNHAFFQTVGLRGLRAPDAEDLVRGVVDTLWEGIAP